MSRIQEALVFQTDDERIEWFQALSPEEQAEVVKDAAQYMENLKNALQPFIESFMKWWREVYPVISKLILLFFSANANNESDEHCEYCAE